MNETTESPQISVVMPVYNTEKYVEEAVLSIMNQNFRDIEIIIINDGSTDNSLPIIQDLATTDKRIKVYSQENKGQSVARNLGIEKASGKYIYFMDSDDLIDHEAFSACHTRLLSDYLDFVLFDADFLNRQHQFSIAFNYDRSHDLSEEKIYSGIEVLNIMLTGKSYKCSPCLHFIKTKFLRDHAIFFYPGIIHEDELFAALLYLNADRVAYINRSFFRRRLREGSVMTKKYAFFNIRSYFTVIDQLIQYSRHRSEKAVSLIVDKLIFYILDPNIYKANTLNLRERIGIFFFCVSHHYLKYISMKSIVVLIFPITIRIKAKMRRFI